MSTTTTTLPTKLNAGDTLKFVASNVDYAPADGWKVELVLMCPPNRYRAESTAVGADHQILVSAAVTNRWAAGVYTARLRAIKGQEAYTLVDATLAVSAAFAPPPDPRSQARRMLEAIEATIEKRATDGVLSYQIAGRELRYTPMVELIKLRDRFKAEVLREEAADRAAQGLQPRGRIAVRFG